MEVIQGQCKKRSKVVSDISKIKPLINEMTKLCNQPLGLYPSAIALAHCQVDHESPLRFFVYADGSAVINPEIIDLTLSGTSTTKEGCYSYAFRPEKKVKRKNKIKVRYTKLSGEKVEEVIVGKLAHVFQHEIDHFNGKAIYK